MNIADYYIDHQTELLSLTDVIAILKAHSINGLRDESTGSSFYSDHLQWLCLPDPLVRASVVFGWLGY